MDKITLIHAAPYERVRDLCHSIKESGRAYTVAREDLQPIADSIPAGALLVPVPGHNGRATHTLDLCIRILGLCPRTKNIVVLDVLKGKRRRSLCALKHLGLPTDGVEVSFTLREEEADSRQVSLLAGKHDIVLVDNVLDSGRTARAAQAALGVPCKVAVIGTTGLSGLEAKKTND